MNIIRWHKEFSEKKRLFYGLSHYGAYWVSWIKGIIFGMLIMYFIF
jgi:hypothetical protein